jgi:hypothetical protein
MTAADIVPAGTMVGSYRIGHGWISSRPRRRPLGRSSNCDKDPV